MRAVGASGSSQGGHFEEVTGQLGATGYTGSVCSGNSSRGGASDLGRRNRTKMLAVADCFEAEVREDRGARQTLVGAAAEDAFAHRRRHPGETPVAAWQRTQPP